MKRALLAIVVIGIFLMTLEVSTYLYRSSHSESIASEKVQDLCRDEGYDLTKLSGPIKDGNVPPSYSWIYRDSTHHLELLVVFDDLYDGKVAIWDYDRKD